MPEAVIARYPRIAAGIRVGEAYGAKDPRKVQAIGLGLADASRCVATHAADYLGATDRGRLTPGAWGDAVLLDRDLNLQDVFVEGSSIEHAHAG